MSASDYDVMQDKDADTPMVWKDFVGLCNHLEGVLESSTQKAVNAHQELQLQVKGTTKNIIAMQAQFTTFQQSIDQLTQSLATLRHTIALPPVWPADDESVHDNANLLIPNARGHGLGQQGRPRPVLCAQCVLPADDDFLGKPKFLIP
jgi:hypothetical protein